jgi:transcription elongation factor Elf1
MKKSFVCLKCGAMNEFETNGALMHLTEAKKVEKSHVYIVACRHCGAQNRVEVKEGADE